MLFEKKSRHSPRWFFFSESFTLIWLAILREIPWKLGGRASFLLYYVNFSNINFLLRNFLYVHSHGHSGSFPSNHWITLFYLVQHVVHIPGNNWCTCLIKHWVFLHAGGSVPVPGVPGWPSCLFKCKLCSYENRTAGTVITTHIKKYTDV